MKCIWTKQEEKGHHDRARSGTGHNRKFLLLTIPPGWQTGFAFLLQLMLVYMSPNIGFIDFALLQEMSIQRAKWLADYSMNWETSSLKIVEEYNIMGSARQKAGLPQGDSVDGWVLQPSLWSTQPSQQVPCSSSCTEHGRETALLSDLYDVVSEPGLPLPTQAPSSALVFMPHCSLSLSDGQPFW